VRESTEDITSFFTRRLYFEEIKWAKFTVIFSHNRGRTIKFMFPSYRHNGYEL
jgi:hypothetical protein